MIANRLADRAVSLAADALSLQPRHEAALRSASLNLSAATDLLQPMRTQRALTYPELVAASMRSALNDLSSLAGDITPDDVLARVFATFCIGK
jgi:tRNA modification GTPase